MLLLLRGKPRPRPLSGTQCRSTGSCQWCVRMLCGQYRSQFRGIRGFTGPITLPAAPAADVPPFKPELCGEVGPKMNRKRSRLRVCSAVISWGEVKGCRADATAGDVCRTGGVQRPSLSGARFILRVCSASVIYSTARAKLRVSWGGAREGKPPLPAMTTGRVAGLYIFFLSKGLTLQSPLSLLYATVGPTA